MKIYYQVDGFSEQSKKWQKYQSCEFRTLRGAREEKKLSEEWIKNTQNGRMSGWLKFRIVKTTVIKEVVK